MTENEKTEFIAKLLIGKKKGGTIKEWAKVGNTIVGTLASDTYEPIKTSNVIKIHNVEDQLVAETLNSYYYLLEKGDAHEFYTNLAMYESQKVNKE